MIQVQNLCKSYGDFVALDNLSFEVGKGRILGFLGPNGAGKTTTMRIMSCFMPPTSGAVFINGMDLASRNLEARRYIGYLPETPPLYPDMRVDEYLVYVAGLKGVPSGLIPTRLAAVKEQCGLSDMGRKLIRALSKGYRQRVGIAQSIINDPEVLILDEPTVGLDPKQITDIRNLIKSLAGERTVILSTHILSEVTLICDDILIINQGRMMFKDSLAGIGEIADLERLFLHYASGNAGDGAGMKERRE